MVKGRRGRVKAVPSHCNNTFSKRKYATRNEAPKDKNGTLVEQCITDYFKCLDQHSGCGDNEYKIDLEFGDVDIKRNYEEDKFLMVVEEKFHVLDTTPSFAKNFVPKSPHRIQLTSHQTDTKIKTDNLVKSHLIKDKKPKTKLAKTNCETDHKLTEYFPIRRSERKTKRIVLEEKQKNLEQLLKDGIEEGLRVHYFDGKGRGVVAVKPFSRGDFVVEYSGELLDVAQAKIREAKYAEDENTGCYMYYFKYLNQQYCIDATPETGRLGRLVNHSRNGNLVTRTVVVDGYPHLVLIAKDDIDVGQEISYDYGDRSKESLKNHPWLAL
ncbi:hypothetical protein RN001_010668 [Aquatica leii]|uniref:[histone H4]-lysine(20) N-methyltransferase n=1 Tax=Aquatica leii TaxID=1421715 RepID=A0AAN7SEL0_9COLE|nr:hypothetical protein RN001_010668 [Aquatica leii]